MTSDRRRPRPIRFDLSPPVSPALGVWPGDNPASREVLAELDAGDHLTLSTLRTTVHLGTHADAPSHTQAGGATIDAVDLDAYLGSCQVIPLDIERGELIEPTDLQTAITQPRVLLATGTFPDPTRFTTDFAAPSVALVAYLAAAGVVLLGTDAPSMDLFGSKDLPSHRALVQSRIAVLEGLVLHGVPAGDYELVALPLPLVGFDASPVRAVLRDRD
ncbi:MAG: cyclase family protein [Acidimicrobiia bacterium]|nr:cyclase family protein [Acidimicrobiia bacterium]MDH5236614.1 cyclase family protein [Acidimicrobiia bacterium]